MTKYRHRQNHAIGVRREEMKKMDMYISTLLSAIFIPTFIMIIISILNKSKVSAENKFNDRQFVVELPSIVLGVGLLLDITCIAVIIGFTILSPTPPHVIFYVTFGLGIWIGTYLALKTLRFKVYVQDEKVTVQNVFGRPIVFTFSEIVSAKRQVKNNNLKSERIIIKTVSGKKIIVESTEKSYKQFLNRIKAEVDNEFLFGFE